MKGNQRPQAAAMSQAQADLPSARIRCSADRIQVGSRTYQSASDALSAYMQQFDPRKPGGVGSGTSVRDSSLSAVIYKSSGSGGTSRGKLDPANVTGLLTGSAENGTMSDTMMSTCSPCLLNGVGSPHRSPKHSVSFSLPDDSLRRSKLSATVGVSGSSHSVSSPGQHSSSLFESRLLGTEVSHSMTHSRSSHLLGLSQLSDMSAALSPHNASANGREVSHRCISQSNGFVDNGRPALTSKLTHNGQPPERSVSQAQTRSSGAPASGSGRARSEVEVLLTEAPSQSEVSALGQMSAGEGQLRSMLQDTSGPLSSSTASDKSALQQEVEQALSRSAQLLETIKTDILVSPRCVSDVDSLSTDVLLSINPQNPAESMAAAVGGREGRSRHRYSYHTAGHQPRSVSVGPVMGGPAPCVLHRRGRRLSVDSLESSGTARQKFLDFSDSMSALSDSESILKRLQAADVRSDLTADSKETDPGGRTGPPSWIQELIPPTSTTRGKDVTDSLFLGRDASGGRNAPSWVNGLEQSDAASSVNTQDMHDAAETLMLVKELHGADTVRKAYEVAMKGQDTSAASDRSYAGPGLNYSDLVSIPAGKRPMAGTLAAQFQSKPSARVTRTHSFGAMGSSPMVRRPLDKSKPPVTMSRVFQDLAGVDTARPAPHTTEPNLSSSLGAAEGSSAASILRRKVCEDSADILRHLDRHRGGSEGGDGGRRGLVERMSEIPRCSSMMQNGTGDDLDMPSNITGASSISRDSNFSNKLCLDDPSLTPARHSRVLSAVRGGREGEEASHEEMGRGVENADPDLLEGDRPWENMGPSFKAPVYVGSSNPSLPQADMSRPETPTLSGGQQPGSMEALKQMLFRLQSEESSSAATTTTITTAAAALQDSGENELVPALKDYDFEVEPGGQSLERALVHLGRLKTLVQTGTAPGSAQPPAPGMVDYTPSSYS